MAHEIHLDADHPNEKEKTVNETRLTFKAPNTFQELCLPYAWETDNF